MNKTSIEWTEKTWNPITGCDYQSSGCKNCYAKAMAKRLQAMGNKRYQHGFNVTIHPDLFDVPLKLKKPSMIFVCSMSDLFHEYISYDVIKQIFNVMKQAHWHTFQVLTKRAGRLQLFSGVYDIPDNVWVGVTVENKQVTNRIKDLKDTYANTKYLSCEPLLESLQNIDLDDIDWVIVGGESGHNARPIEEAWVIELRDLCKMYNKPFFFKQWGGKNKKKNGNLLQGKVYNEMPIKEDNK